MIWQWYAFFALTGVIALVVPGYVFDVFGDWSGPFVLALTCGFAAVCFGLAGLTISIDRHYGRITCRTFAAQTNRPTRFVVYNSWSSGDCLTPDGRGRWIPTKNLREFGSGR